MAELLLPSKTTKEKQGRTGRSAAEYVSPEFSGLWGFIPVICHSADIILYPAEENTPIAGNCFFGGNTRQEKYIIR
jgi:hypothetical protein